MKKYTLGCLMVLLGVYTASARQITPAEAMSVASDFMSSSELKCAVSKNSTLRMMKAPGVDANASVSPYYIFNRGENEGFVIISGDDRAPKVLGYSDKGRFDGENLPPQLKGMLDLWVTGMSHLTTNLRQHPSWSEKSQFTRAGSEIIHETAEWGQGYPYNALCPIIEGEQAPTGCIATAMAIAMKFHNWPDRTRGDKQVDFECPEVSFDFSDYVIDWDVLSDQNNPNFANEVSKLTLSAGVAAQMFYGPMESSAYDWPYAHQLMQFYIYSKDCQYIERSRFSDEAWNNLLQTQLAEVGPVIYRGSNTVGHAFIIDGYDGSSLYHVNWGWDGLLNGYYNLDFTDMGYDQYQGMVINIKPDKERREYSKSFIPNVDAYIAGTFGCEGWNFMTPDIVPGKYTYFRMPSTCLNEHVGAYGIAVVDEDDNILQILDEFTYNSGLREVCPWPGNDPTLKLVFPELKDGQRFQIVSQEIEYVENYGYLEPSLDPEDWKIVLGGMIYPSYFYDKGNRSDLAEVKYHVDESMPFFATIANTSDHEYSIKQLKGNGCWENVLRPRKGLSYEVKGFDKDGNPVEALFSGGEVLEEPTFGINISMYSDRYEVYLNYEYDGDSRKDGLFPEDSIVESEGLIYHIIDEGIELIGYDDIPEVVVIPEYIEHNGSNMPVVKIADDALLFAPSKELIINANQLMDVGNCAFAGMKNLSTVSFEKTKLFTSSWVKPFLMTDVKDVFLENEAIANLISQSMNFNYLGLGYENPYFIGNKDISFYMSTLPYDVYSYYYILNEVEEAMRSDAFDQVMNSFNIPGTGDALYGKLLEFYHLPIVQMWTYELDKQHGLLSIKDPLSNVSIDKVIIDGIDAEKNSNGLYEFPNEDYNNPEIIIEYTVNDTKKLTTIYSSDYNSMIESADLSNGIESNFIEIRIMDIYDINGILVKKAIDYEYLNSLTPGIYLIRNGNEMKKLVIR